MKKETIERELDELRSFSNFGSRKFKKSCLNCSLASGKCPDPIGNEEAPKACKSWKK